MEPYNWQQADWLQFKYDLEGVKETLQALGQETAYITGMLAALPKETQVEAMINLMAEEAMKTSEIEGEYLQRSDVLSSIRRNLGLAVQKEQVNDERAQGAGELMVEINNNFETALSEDMLFNWHKMLMKGAKGIAVASWRTHKEPMQVVSGAIGKEKVHFEAPPSSQVPNEMEKFVIWFNETAPGGRREIKESSVRSAIAHLYFETIHPFEDGNGRIGRAVAEKALSQGVKRPILLSLSKVIEAKKKLYYEQLQKAQSSNEITEWVEYFVNVILESQIQAKELIETTLKKAKFFDEYKGKINERQMKVLKKMFEAEPKGFAGGMTANKYISITKASKATATRDLQELKELGALIIKGGGRSIHYILNIKSNNY